MAPHQHPRAAFAVNVTDRGDAVIIETAGGLNWAPDPLLGATLAQAEALDRPVVVDMTAGSFCASCILGQLADAATQLSQAGRVLVVATDEYVVRRRMTLLSMDRHLTVVPQRARGPETSRVACCVPGATESRPARIRTRPTQS